MAILQGHHFYNQSLRKYITAFGDMFNGIVVQRLDSTNTRVQTIAVPIAYAPKEKWLARMTSDPNLTRPIAAVMPSMAFEINSMVYDGTRRLSSTTQNMAVNNSSTASALSQYVPVPWNLNFSLYIFVRNADDGAQILGQILPFFGPEWTNSISLIPSMGLKYDIPTVLNDVISEDVYDGDFFTRRSLIHTINFTMKGYFFGPVRSTGSRSKLIKRIQLDFNVPKSANVWNSIDTFTITTDDIARTGRNSRVVITPGLLANGSPTTNSAASIDWHLISSNTNYGIASNNFFYTDGRKFNPITGSDE